MGTLWGFAGWWCLIPLLFMIVLAVGCMLFMGRRGGCGPAGASCCGRHENEPRKPA